jgi:hypothetical protein
MKKFCLFIVIVLFYSSVKAQVQVSPFIKDMQWGIDYQIHLTLSNDSSFTLNVKDLFHTNSTADSSSKDFVYYPVMLASEFVNQLNNLKINTKGENESDLANKPLSLWGSLHASIGGGWIHFLNCMTYSLETNYLDPTAPLMIRPKTNWKPDPVTKSYLRTKKWKYYVPYEQKFALKEYKIRKKEGQLNDLQHIPTEWIDLFLQTSQQEYKKMKANKEYKLTSRIDLVKILLGSNYLGKAQISYIQTMVQKAILQYSFNRLPTVIVFDDIQVAVAMALDEKGYRMEKIVFRNVNELSPEEKYNKEMQVKNTVRSINLLNQKLFEQKLKKYYQ